MSKTQTVKSGDYVLVKDHGQEWSNWSYIYIGPHPHGKGHYVISKDMKPGSVLHFDEVKLVVSQLYTAWDIMSGNTTA